MWVADGVYRPDFNTVTELHTGDRNQSFVLVNGVGVYGGFDGTEVSFSQRAGLFSLTILSGDLNANDGPNFTNIADNSVHVVRASNQNSNSVLDGFTISGGNTDAPFPDNGGGGMIITESDMQLRNCIFTTNIATAAAGFGGGLFISSQSAPTLVSCTFQGNSAVGTGGGLKVSGTSGQPGQTVMVNCVFLGNTAEDGGGISNSNANPTLINCLLAGNSATLSGGAMHNIGPLGSSPLLINCALTENTAGSDGGGIVNLGTGPSSPTITNSILYANSDSGGSDESAQITTVSGTPVVNYSNIQGLTGGLGGAGNIGLDPLFADPDGADNDPATLADNNYRLSTGSPCIDAGDNNAVAPCSTDLDVNIRQVDDPATVDSGLGSPPVVDMGPYEFGSTPLVGTDCNSNTLSDTCEINEMLVEDCNTNLFPDDCDIAGGTSDDCSGNGTPDECEPDCNNNQQADDCDLLDGTSDDCSGNGIPDECEPDCNDNDIVDSCEIADKISPDCNANGVPDECDIASGDSQDNNVDGIPDDCPMLVAFDETSPEAEALGLRTCRLYVQFDNLDDRLLSIGFAGISTDDPAGFHQDALGEENAPLQAIIDLFPEVAIDSYVTIGVDSDDGTDTTSIDPSWNTCAFNCQPQPPCVPGGLALPGGCGEAVGGWLNTFPPNDQGAPDGNFRVLVAQFTVNDGFSVSGSRSVFINDGLVAFPGIFQCFSCDMDIECDDGNPCTADQCFLGQCLSQVVPDGTGCPGNGTTDCSDVDTCVAGACQDNDFAAGTVCTDDGNDCSQDVCDGSGTCTHPNAPFGQTCDLDGDLCTIDQCNGAGLCQFNSNLTCPPAQQCVNGKCVDECPGDLNGDGLINAADLAILLGNWGVCD